MKVPVLEWSAKLALSVPLSARHRRNGGPRNRLAVDFGGELEPPFFYGGPFPFPLTFPGVSYSQYRLPSRISSIGSIRQRPRDHACTEIQPSKVAVGSGGYRSAPDVAFAAYRQITASSASAWATIR